MTLARIELRCGCGVAWSLEGGSQVDRARFLEAWHEAHELHRRPDPSPDTVRVVVQYRPVELAEWQAGDAWDVTTDRLTTVPLARGQEVGLRLLAVGPVPVTSGWERPDGALVGDEGPERLDRDADTGP